MRACVFQLGRATVWAGTAVVEDLVESTGLDVPIGVGDARLVKRTSLSSPGQI